MKTGFTLAELIGVIAILSIISLITVPLIDNSINNSNDKLYQTQINQIIKGAKSYYSDSKANHISELPQNNGDVATITLGKLQDEGYLPSGDIENPKTKKAFPPTLTVKVTNNGGNQFVYEIDESTIGE